MIQIANLADSFAAIKQLVYDEGKVSKERLLKALQTNYKDDEILRTMLLNKVPKYGNDVEWVDELGAKWAGYFRERIGNFKTIVVENIIQECIQFLRMYLWVKMLVHLLMEDIQEHH